MQTAGMQSTGSTASSTASPASPEAAQTAPSVANGSALTPTSSSSEGHCLRTPIQGWADKFVIPWGLLSEDFLASCKEGKQPAKPLVLDAVRKVAGEINKISSHPGINNLRTIARSMVEAYPKSLADQLPGVGILGDGTTTLVNRLVRQFENMNRNTGNSLRRKLLAPTVEDSPESSGEPKKTKGVAPSRLARDSYGCVNWQPELPRKETTESQIEKKEWLQKEYQVCPEFRSVSKVHQLMKDTFPSQRFMLNQLINGKAAYTAQQIKTEWPFLLTTDGLLRHFEILMGFNITERFATQFSLIGPKLLELSGKLGSEGRKEALELEAQSVALKNDISKTFGSFLLLRHFFEEKQLLLVTNLVR